MLSLSFGCRIGWCLLRAGHHNDFSDHIVNRISLLAFFSGFVVYVLGWAQVLDAKWMPKLNRAALIGTVVFAFLIFATSVWAELLSGEKRKRVYDGNLMVIVIMHVVLAFVFFYLAVRLRSRLMALYKKSQSRLALATSRKVMAATAVCVLCFVERAFFWCYEPITGKEFPGDVYPWMYYEVPELLPGIAMIFLIAPSTKAKTRPSSSQNAGAGIGKHKGCLCWCCRKHDRTLHNELPRSPRSVHSGPQYYGDEYSDDSDVEHAPQRQTLRRPLLQ